MKGFFSLQLLIFLTFQVSFGQSEKVNYTIGYKSVKYIDLSRSHNSINRELGKEDSLNTHRTITSSMWYPASENGPNHLMKFGEFLSTIEMNDKHDYRIRDSIVSQADKFAGYYGLNKKDLERIEGIPTTAYQSPDFLVNSFPLVIYIPGLNGFSFENHLLCESIARHGNVVIAFNSKGSEGRWMGFSDPDFENLIRDIQFLIGESSKYPMINSSKIVLIGHSIGGHANILTKIRDNRITGLVSLDGSMKHDLERSNRFIFNDYGKINCPLLSISNQDFTVARLYLDSLHHANCFYIQTTELGHSDYKSLPYLLKGEYDHGKFDKYLSVNDLIVAFVEMINGRDVNKNFETHVQALVNSQFVKYDYIASTPGIDEFKSKIGDMGFSNAKSQYESIQTKSPDFRIPENELVVWANRLKYSGHISEAIEIYNLIIFLYPHNQSVKNKLNRLSDY
jgi:pimeloyl-ACP methyl ester carboxylesterase